MNAQELKDLRKKRGWTQKKTAEALNTTLGRAYDAGSVGRWENGKKNIPPDVGAFFDRIASAAVEDEPLDLPLDDGPQDSTPPPPDNPDAGSPLPMLPGGIQLYSKICEEFFELLATAAGTAGAVSGSEKLLADRDVLLRDKEDLGKAWGRLAEKNETFRKMITGGPNDAAVYIQILLVTGATANRIARNHQPRQVVVDPEPQSQPEPEGRMYGDGAVIDLPV